VRTELRSWVAAGCAVCVVAAACAGKVEIDLDHAATGGDGAGTRSETPRGGSAIVGASGGMVMGGGSPGDIAGNITRDEFAQLYPAIVCGNWARCCPGTSFQSQGCLAARAAAIATLLDDPFVRYDPSGGGACLRAAQTASAGCDDATPDPTYGACRPAFSGALPLGAKCTSDAQCASPADGIGVCASGATDPAQRFCEYVLAPRHGSLGEACWCTPDSPWESCITYWTSTGPLEPDAGCYVADGLYCDGTCQRQSGLGDSCQKYQPSCGAGLACGDNYVCQPLPGSGEPCVQGACQSGLFCNADSRCEPVRRLGESCESSRCEPTLHCSLSTGTCAGPEPNGAPCRSSWDCESQLCNAEGGSINRCTATADATYCAYFSGAIPALPPIGL
jgi:hypothetical protein